MSQHGTKGIRDKGILMGQRDPIYGTIGILMGLGALGWGSTVSGHQDLLLLLEEEDLLLL